MIHICQDTVIYVLCPAHIVTGGIEAVHQLVDKLRKIGHQARIVTMPIVANPVLLQYRNYEVEFATGIEDKQHNVLIVTEVNPRALDQYGSIQKALWWLSVDNHEKLTEKFDFLAANNRDVTHFAQSAYAYAFLKARGVSTIYPLTDYLHAEYLRRVRCNKSNVVLYTPVKGAETYVNQLIQAEPSILWLPLKGMIRKMHAKVLRHGKVYVDFGSHPGKDRQPREAVVNGCCVVVGLRGSAVFAEDVPIPAAYKFALEPMDVPALLATIQSCLVNYDMRIQDFAAYEQMVRHEEKEFEQEVANIFGIVALKDRSHTGIVFHNVGNFWLQNNALTVMRGLVNEFLPLALTNFARRMVLQISAKLISRKR